MDLALLVTVLKAFLLLLGLIVVFHKTLVTFVHYIIEVYTSLPYTIIKWIRNLKRVSLAGSSEDDVNCYAPDGSWTGGIPITSESENPHDQDWLHAIIRQGNVHLWAFPHSISQCEFGGRETVSNACVFIAISIAKILHVCHFPKEIPKKIPEWIVHMVCNAIQDGNDAHSNAMLTRTRKGEFFTISEAICALGEIYEVDFLKCKGSLKRKLMCLILDAVYSPVIEILPNIYMLLMVIERCVLFCYDRKSGTITFFDSHGTMFTGSLIISSSLDDLIHLCTWVFREAFPDLEHTDDFEMSVIQILSRDCSGKIQKMVTGEVFRRDHIERSM